MEMQKMFKILLMICGCMFISTIVSADFSTLEDLRLVQAKAKKGDTDSQLELSQMYIVGGHGFEMNLIESKKWLKIAADNNNAVAQFDYAILLRSNKDYTQAIRYLEKSSDLQQLSSSYELAMHYFHGVGVKQNYSKAIHFLEQVRINKNSSNMSDLNNYWAYFQSMNLLSSMYYRGIGFPRSNENAIAILQEAKEFNLSNETTESVVSSMLQMGDAYLADVDSGFHIKKDINEARFWYKYGYLLSKSSDFRADSSGFIERLSTL